MPAFTYNSPSDARGHFENYSCIFPPLKLHSSSVLVDNINSPFELNRMLGHTRLGLRKGVGHSYRARGTYI